MGRPDRPEREDLEWALEVLEEPLGDRPAWKGPRGPDHEDYYRHNDAWAVVTAELDRLREERAHCYRTLRQISTEDLPVAGDGGPQEVLIAMHSALLDLIDYLEDDDES